MNHRSAIHYVIAIAVIACLQSGCNNAASSELPTIQESSAAAGGLEQEGSSEQEQTGFSAKEILGNADYLAFSYGGYRKTTRDDVPDVDQLKEDMRLLSAMKIKLLRTYNTQQYAHAANLLEAIRQLRTEDPEFEMYVMLGAWIDCEGAWGDAPNHDAGSVENNTAEINAAVDLANKYPEIVKIIAVGNEAMVHWAGSYFVQPGVILKWVEHLQSLKESGRLPKDLWITSSDNFASWGGGDDSYHNDDLTALIKSVDFVSLHTYPFHDTHYNPEFWGVPELETSLSATERADAAMLRARDYAVSQYQATADYIAGLGIEKPIHIGETGWASRTNALYGESGSCAADEYKQKAFYEAMREWTNESGMTCFYFEAFDEPWKDAQNDLGSENHFGLINIKGQAKFALWDHVDNGTFNDLKRGGSVITKTFDGEESAFLASILKVPAASETGGLMLSTVNDQRETGEVVSENQYVVINESLVPDGSNSICYPSAPLKINAWEGTCVMSLSGSNEVHVATGTGDWWGCGLELQADGKGEDLSNFESGTMHFEIKGDTQSPFVIGFQTGQYTAGTQINCQVAFSEDGDRQLSAEWKTWSIPVSEFGRNAVLSDVTSLMFLRGENGSDGKNIEVRNIYFSRQ